MLCGTTGTALRRGRPFTIKIKLRAIALDSVDAASTVNPHGT
jgi:hypothetical protein